MLELLTLKHLYELRQVMRYAQSDYKQGNSTIFYHVHDPNAEPLTWQEYHTKQEALAICLEEIDNEIIKRSKPQQS